MVRLLVERFDTKSNVKLGGFRSQLQASYVYIHTEELWYNETVCLSMTIYIYLYVCVCVQKIIFIQRIEILRNKIIFAASLIAYQLFKKILN